MDDAADNRDICSMLFEFVGFTVTQAVDGEDALAKIDAWKPDVVIMDLSMPRMDGWEATRRIKANPETKMIPVIVLTAHATPRDLRQAWAAGADDICVKPCMPADLLGRVRAVLGVAP